MRSNPRLVAFVWLATRALMFGVVVLACQRNSLSLEQALSHWDVQHFMTVAKAGYENPVEMAFFPGLPIVMRALSLVNVPMWLTGVGFALVCSALAVVALERMYGSAAACLWLLAPMSVFTIVGYTEAPFVAAAFWAWERARSGRWAQAGILVALACSLRISGLFLIAGLGILALTQTEYWFKDRIKNAAWLLLGAGVLGGFAAYLHSKTGSWSAWYNAQNAGWHRELSWPWEALQRTIPMTSADYWPGRPEVPVMFTLEIVAVAIGYLVLLVCLFRRRWGEATFVAANVVPLSSSGWFMSVTRAVLLLFPLYGWLGGFGGRRSSSFVRAVLGLILIGDLVLMGWWTYCFASGAWAC